MTDTVGAQSRDHFFRLVRQWSNFGPPLRPWPADTAVVQRVIDGLPLRPRALVLGLTPETVGCDWPEGTRLLAVDHSVAMIGALWPSSRKPPHARAIAGAWQALPVASRSLDLVIGDGIHASMPSLEGAAALSQEVGRVLRPGSLLVVRAFLRPDRAESPEEVARALAAGEVGSVHALKLRLLAALHGLTGVGSRLGDVWQAWKTLPFPGPSVDPGARGWTKEELEGIEAYRGQQTRYYLATLAEFRGAVSPWFDEIECARSPHELSDRCPTFVLRRRS